MGYPGSLGQVQGPCSCLGVWGRWQGTCYSCRRSRAKPEEGQEAWAARDTTGCETKPCGSRWEPGQEKSLEGCSDLKRQMS